MNEKEYELREVRLGRFTKRIKVRLLETTYEYKQPKGNKSAPYELCIVRKKVKRVLKSSTEVLEGLPCHVDDAVRKYCEQIAECVGERLYPVWYRIILIERERDAAREELHAERTRVNAEYDNESAPYKHEAKVLSASLLGAYAGAEDAEDELAIATAAYGRFDEKSKSKLACLVWWKYSDEKRTELACAVDTASEKLSEQRESIRTLEAELHLSAQKISECEGRRAIAMSEFDAREDSLERSYTDRLNMLK